ncbi:MAG: type II toxin-antitoxin system VapC family toxin [Terricaulis sp.]
MSAYLDASVLVALFTNDTMTTAATALVKAAPPPLMVSDFAGLEFASAISRIARMRLLPNATARQALADLDVFVSRSAISVEISSLDVVLAASFIRRLDLNLRGPDAMHVAMASRLGATLFTLDAKLKACARKLGLSVG